MIEGVAAELELDAQPFLISSSALGARNAAEPLSAVGGEFSGVMTGFDAEVKGRQDR
jgi:hypothetical protein